MDVGLIGLGAMGSAMAANIAKAGHTVRAWNRSPGDPIAQVTRVDSPAEAFDADVVLTMLPDDATIRAVILDAGLLSRARHGAVHVVCSTISIAFAEELTKRHADVGVRYVSAPVLGRPDVAAAGELNVLSAGAADALETVAPVLSAIGKRAWVMGEAPRQANAAKIAANMMITMAIEAMAEAVVLTESQGVGREAFFDVMLNTLFGGRAYQTYSAKIANSAYDPGFKARLGLKDLRLASDAAKMASRDLPMLAAVKGRMAEAVDAGLGERDWSIMADYTINHGR
jgi:3-hydroxyisobutyrate dehydrogenase-like beta-hydroxyacid dehydrogenase